MPQKNKSKSERLSKKESEVIETWTGKKSFQYMRHNETVYAIPENITKDISFLSSGLRIIYSGVAIGQIIRDKLIPDHALSMSLLLNDSVPYIDVNFETAIEYLRKKELKINANEKGWQLVKYEGHNLGWINVLPNRINNYYPKELRILKES